MYHPSRGGVRGGQDQFDWEDVKSDKYRESYLGELFLFCSFEGLKLFKIHILFSLVSRKKNELRTL